MNQGPFAHSSRVVAGKEPSWAGIHRRFCSLGLTKVFKARLHDSPHEPRKVLRASASSKSGQSVGQAAPSQPADLEDGYLAFFASMLGTNNSAQDREDAASALWQQSFESTEKLERIGEIPGEGVMSHHVWGDSFSYVGVQGCCQPKTPNESRR